MNLFESEELKSKHGLNDKISYLISLPELRNPVYQSDRDVRTKDDSESEKLRNKGNQMYQENKFRQAVETFSSAAMRATFNQVSNNSDGLVSKSYSLAIANRSLALVKLEKYQEN